MAKWKKANDVSIVKKSALKKHSTAALGAKNQLVMNLVLLAARVAWSHY